jgi:hypothetical protein
MTTSKDSEKSNLEVIHFLPEPGEKSYWDNTFEHIKKSSSADHIYLCYFKKNRNDSFVEYYALTAEPEPTASVSMLFEKFSVGKKVDGTAYKHIELKVGESML